MQTLVQQLWHVMYVVTLVRVYTGQSCAGYSVTYFKGITIFDISELLYRVGLICIDALQSACEPRLSASSVALQIQ